MLNNVANITDYKHELNYDGQITLATGKSRYEKNWKNKKMLWSALVSKLACPVITPEAYAEYMKMPKAEQDKVKDVGGYVGGSLKNGQRKAGNVISRQILTLDLDFAPIDFFTPLELLSEYACCVYSTHKHSSKTPRFRLLIPLDREVSADEYEAIARMVASDIGMDYFDDTTYQPSRLMYWPSHSSDGEYFYKYIDSPFLCADKVLARYDDWTDTSFWPESSRAAGIRKKMADKQGDPCEKKGLIGAFCRTYTVPEAIEKFIPGVYVQCEREDRFTYAGGSTAAGLVIYEDGKFAYSNHGTDPASGKLCNAFDLVRIHKYGSQDEDIAPDTEVTKLPSYKAMTEMVQNDKNTKGTLGRERLNNAKKEFEVVPGNWVEQLDLDKAGNLKPTIDNIKMILTFDEVLKGMSGYNEFDFKTAILKGVPWRKVKPGDVWTDADDAGLMHYLESVYGLYAPKKTEEALEIVQQNNRFHPVREYLESLPEWDGVKRLENLFIDYLGADDTEYVRTVTRKAFVAAVARIYRPGIKFDNMLTLVGPQGLGKSYILKVMGREWYSDSLITVQGKEAYESLHGSWLLEMAELTAAKKAEVEAVKHFISKQEDIYRAAYARRSMNYPRQCVFFGTTNDAEFLRDRTGNRRFWPVEVGRQVIVKDIFNELENDVEQIWAEAKYLFDNGESLYLDKRINDMAIEKQKEHTEQDSRQGLVEEFLEMELPVNWNSMSLWQRRDYLDGNTALSKGTDGTKRDRVCAMEIWQELFGKDAGSFNKVAAREINAMIDNVEGWKKADKAIKFGKLYGTQRGYKRG